VHAAPVTSSTVVAVDVGKTLVALSVTDASRHRLFGPVEFAMTRPALSAVIRVNSGCRCRHRPTAASSSQTSTRGTAPNGHAAVPGVAICARSHDERPDALATGGGALQAQPLLVSRHFNPDAGWQPRVEAEQHLGN
jgi:hypothetical protein